MVKLTKSMPIVKERTCTASMVLDTRTNRKNVSEFPLAVRFTIDRKLFYYQVGGSYTEKKFSDICNASKSASDNYRMQKEWRDTFATKYKDLLENLNKGGILTYEMVRQAVVEGNTYTVQTSNNTENALSFIGIWEQTIRELRTNDNGARFTIAESYEYSLKSFKKILGDETIKGFDVSAAEIQKWKDGMHDGVVGKGGKLEGKISDTTAGIYLRCCRAVWNRCVREGYLKDVPYPFSNKKEKGLVKFKAKVDDADMEQAINNRKKLIENESKLLEDHRKENKEILTRHFYDMSNMMSRNEGVWLSNGWVKTLLWIFLPCFLYTVISIVFFCCIVHR